MADRFPLIVNSVSKKIEELVSGDNLDLTGNGIVVSTDTGAGKYLTSDGTTVFWGAPGDVYLTQTQTLTNKTLESSIISGSNNTISNIANSSLVNSGITVNGTTIPLGGTVVTPDNNTTYVVSAEDGLATSEKIIRLTSGGNSGAGVDDDIILAVGAPASVPSGSNSVSLFLDRAGDKLTVSGHVVDNNTITTLNAPGGSNTSGAINFTSTGAATVSMTGSTINVDALDTDTRTKIRAGSGGTYGPADTQQGLFTFLDGTGTTVSQSVDGNGDPTITYTSTDNVTQIRGGSTGTYTPTATGTSATQVSIEGGTGGNVTVSQSGNTILIDSVDTNTVTKVGSDNNGSPISPQAGDFILKQAGATTITQSTNQSGQIEVTISSINSDTGATLTASNGIILATNDFRLKNASNLGGNTLLKWDDGNAQLADSIITDDGTTVTIGGDLVVSGTQTIFNTTVLQVEDNIIELRKGNNLTGFEGGIQVNRTTDSSGVVTSYQQLQWNETGGYWRSWDGSVENRFVTENETQVLTNKTLTNPTFTTPTLGAATATSINGLEIASTASASLDIQSGKAVDIDNDFTFTSDNATANVNVNFRVGGDVAYRSDTLASFSSTTSTQLRTLISGTTGTDDLVFQTSPVILTSLVTTSTGFALLNSGAQSIQFGGAATQIDIGAQTGTVNLNGDLTVAKDLTVGAANTDLFTCNARVDFANSDILIRGGSTDPMTIGRGTGSVASNTALGKQALFSVSSGSQNTATGYESLFTTNSGAGNSSYGYQALRSNGVGTNNTAMGRSAMLGNLEGDSNVAIGSNALETNTVGDANVCLGFYAGYNATGSGNVLIGPADSTNPVNDATYSPLNAGGDRQLVIGSGTEFWIRGDQNFDVTLNNDVTVNSSLTVKGDFIVNGTQTVVQSNVLEIADKNIELAKVSSTQFSCTTSDGSANISSISPTLGLIPGMVVTSNTAGVSVPGGTTILTISGNTATLSNNVTGAGTPTFSAIGPSDTAADGGGIILKGSPSDHTFTWSNANDAWQSSEDIDIPNGKTYNIIDGAGNAQVVMSEGQVGPNSGTASLGTAVLTSSLTSVGTLVGINVSGNSTLGASTTTNTLTVNGSIIQNNNSSETTFTDKSLPAADSGFYIRNGDGGTGTFAALGLVASSTTAASDQSFSIVAQAQASGLVPKVAFTQRDGNNSQNETMVFSTTGQVLINRTAQHASSSERLSVNGMTSIQFDSTSSAALYIFNEEATTTGNPIQPFLFCHDGGGIRAGLGVQRSTGLTHLNGQFGLVLTTGASGVGGTEKLRVTSIGGTELTRKTVGGQESIGNINNTWWKVGTWAGTGVDAAARATITVLGCNTHNSGNPAGGETKIYLSGTGSTIHATFYSITDYQQGVLGVATKYDQSASSCEVWIKYSAGYSSNSCFADVTNGFFTGTSVNTGTSDVPDGATEGTSKFVLRTSDGSLSLDRLSVKSSGEVSISTEPTSGIGILNIKPGYNDDSFLKFRRAADFNASLDGTAIDSRNSANSTSKDLILRADTLSIWLGTSEKARFKDGSGSADTSFVFDGAICGGNYDANNALVCGRVVKTKGAAFLGPGSSTTHTVGTAYGAGSMVVHCLKVADPSIQSSFLYDVQGRGTGNMNRTNERIITQNSGVNVSVSDTAQGVSLTNNETFTIKYAITIDITGDVLPS